MHRLKMAVATLFKIIPVKQFCCEVETKHTEKSALPARENRTSISALIHQFKIILLTMNFESR